ncbi:23620_t:CDS:2, partial [Dentiscutata erythropus]
LEQEYDMRGRCSAGQKMSASIIIRLALAETNYGAGNAGYGIITSLTFKIHLIQPIVTSINISYYLEQVEVVFMSLSKVSKNLSENITPYLAVMAES